MQVYNCEGVQICKKGQVYKYAGLKASMQVRTYAGKQETNMECKYTSVLVCKYASLQVVKYESKCASLEIFIYVFQQVCMYTSMQVCKYELSKQVGAEL